MLEALEMKEFYSFRHWSTNWLFQKGWGGELAMNSPDYHSCFEKFIKDHTFSIDGKGRIQKVGHFQ